MGVNTKTVIQLNSPNNPNSFTPLPLKLIYIQKNSKSSNLVLKNIIILIFIFAIMTLILTHFYQLGYISKGYKTSSRQVIISKARLPQGGFVVIMFPSHSPNEYRQFVAVSEYLAPGIHQNITIDFSKLINSINANQKLNSGDGIIALLNKDEDGDKKFNQEKDSPYRNLPLIDLFEFSRIFTNIK